MARFGISLPRRCVALVRSGTNCAALGVWRIAERRQTASVVGQRKVDGGPHRAVGDFFIEAHNADPKRFTWTMSADDILASIERFCVYNNPTNF